MGVPKIIHQLWRDTAVPERYLPLVESWQRYHPDWEYRLWTDATMRALVAERYPAFLPVYDGYDQAICRADAARYLILHAFGGVYADLDMLCLRPVDALVDGHALAIALEPPAHLEQGEPKARRLVKIVCPSFMASAQGHPFFEHVTRAMEAARRKPGPLDRTGPFMLTRAFDDYAGQPPVTLLPSETVYPLTNFGCWSGQAFDIEQFEAATRHAYAVHYWDGTWFRQPGRDLPAVPQELNVTITGATGVRHSPSETGFVSCLMVTRDRYSFALLAIEAFRRQTHPDRELVVIVDGDDRRLHEEIERAGDPMIRVARPPANGLSLGVLRNHALAEARGPYVCQWDDDDLYDPERIALQLKALRNAEAEACFLSRWLMWMPLSGRLGVSPPHLWEGSMLALKSALPAYTDATHAEDTILLYDLRRQSRIALLDLPRLYVYAFHGRNAWAADHFEHQWQRCPAQYTGVRYRAVVEELGRRLPMAAYERLLAPTAVPFVLAGSAAAERPDADRLAQSAQLDSLGVNLYCHMVSPTGIGVAARAFAAALAAARIHYTVVDLDQFRGDPRRPENRPPPPLPKGPHPINVFLTTPDRIERLAGGHNPYLTPETLAGCYNIANLVWELANTFPDAWRGVFGRFDEIWVPSRFVADSFRSLTTLPIIEIPHTLQQRPIVLERSDLALPKDRFVFLFLFDGLSGFERKNPLGAIEAFKRAFPPDDRRAALFIKARTLSKDALARLKAAAAGREDILVFVEALIRKALSSLTAHADAYLSLHRSEGFGLTIAEAMQLKRPVVATGYSGNLDFMTPENSYLVPYRLTRLDKAEGVYPAGTEWAEPDLDAAAAIMRAIVADPATARRRGERAAADIAAKYSPLVIGELIQRRLVTLAESGRLNKGSTGPHGVTHQPPAPTTTEPPAARSGSQASPPAVLVLTPVKDALPFLPRYFELLDRLDYDHTRVSLGLLEGDSRDGTFDELTRRLPGLEQRYHNVTLRKHDFGNPLAGPRWRPEQQRARRSLLARVRNRLLAEALTDEEWVLWLDVDLIDYPAGLLNDLLTAGKEIVVPHCVWPNGQTFDLNSFRFDAALGPAEDASHLLDGLYQPPRGHGRRYLGDFGGNGPVPIDAVGGTALLIKADLHREGLVFPAYSHRGYIETEGLAMMARDMGHQSWGLPSVRIVHAAR